MKKKILKIINLILLLAVLVFVIRFLINNLGSLKSFNFELNVKLFCLSIIAVWVWLSISASVFHFIMKKIAPEIKMSENFTIWTNSYLGIYIPGKFGVISFRIMQYQKKNVSIAKVSYGFFIEMILSILSSVFIVLISSIFSGFSFIHNYLPWIISLFILLVILVHPKLINYYAKLYFKYIKKSNDFHITPYNYFFYLKIVGLQLLKWLFAGVGIFILINSVTDLSLNHLPFITGLYAAAAILGLLAFFAPSGIGVVEGVMIFGLKTILTNAFAGLISILIRLWKVIGELSFIALIKLLSLTFLNKTKESSRIKK